MITLITGTPGAGKTLRAIHLIVEAVAQGRDVFTDIDGINIETVHPVGPEYDWRESPEGSLVVFDEVQRRWPSTGRPGHADQEDIRALETHRHTGHDIVVMTQHPTLCHHHVRKLVGQHIHVRRVSNAPVVSLFTSPEVFDPKDKHELRNTDKQTWRYPKKYFSLYKSATAHTHKFKLPAKFKILGLFLILLFSGLIYIVSTIEIFDSSEAQPSAQSEAGAAAGLSAVPVSLPMAHPDYRPPEPATHYAALRAAATADPLPTISGCFSTAQRARCWDNDGMPLDLSREQVLTLLDDMPRALFTGSSGSGSGSGSAPRSDSDSVSPGIPDYDRAPDYQVAQAPRSGWSASGGAWGGYNASP